MKLEIIDATALTQEAARPAEVKPKQKSNKGFEQLLSAADKKEKAKQNEKKPAAEKSSRDHNSASKPKAVDSKNEPAKNAEKAKNGAPDEVSVKDEPEKATLTDEDIVAAVAEILQVPPETILAWLAALNLQPADLSDAKNVALLLQTAFQADSQPVLLTAPEFPAAFKAINEAMAALKPMEQTLELRYENNQPVVTAAQTQAVIVQAAAANTAQEEALPLLAEEAEIQMQDLVQQQGRTVTASNASHNAQAENRQELTPQQPETQAVAEVEQENQFQLNQAMETVSARAQQALAAARPAAAPPLAAAEVIEQIMAQVRVASTEQFSELRVTLRPESLGDVSLRILTQNGIVTAQFVAENQRIREVLESNFNILRNALEEQGIQFSELSVSVRQDDGSERMNRFTQARQQSSQRIQQLTELPHEAEAPAMVDAAEILEGIYDFTA